MAETKGLPMPAMRFNLPKGFVEVQYSTCRNTVGRCRVGTPATKSCGCNDLMIAYICIFYCCCGLLSLKCRIDMHGSGGLLEQA